MKSDKRDSRFEHIRGIINLHRSRALKTVNDESLLICWNVGQYVSTKLQSSEWGSKVVTELSEYLRTKDPGLKGYSRRNIYNMVRFFDTYSSHEFIELAGNTKYKAAIVQPETAQIESDDNKPGEIVQFETAQIYKPENFPSILGKINWTSHVEILNCCRTNGERLFYILYANHERLEVKELRRAIKTNTYNHIIKSENIQSAGMQKKYPGSNYMFKDVAYLDFLGLPQKHSEKRLQKSILENMKDFVLELGKDFLFVGQEYPVQVGSKTFKIDLLFFHRALHCLVALELKTDEFEPAFMGQLEFYLEALDNDVKRSNENPSIGILLCKETNREVVKYALNRSMSPTMIAKYERELIPREVLQSSLREFINFLND